MVSHSNIECEYQVLANAAAELAWIQSLLLKLHSPLFCIPVVLCDNLCTIYLAINPVLHFCAKHVEIHYQFVQEHVLQKTLVVRFIPSVEQLTAVITKALPTLHFLGFHSKLTVLS